MCWGSKHGWKEPVRLAKDRDPTGRDRLRTAVDDRWQVVVEDKEKSVRRPPKIISYPKKIAGVDSGISNLVDWLAEEFAANKHDTDGAHTETEQPARQTGTPQPAALSNIVPTTSIATDTSHPPSADPLQQQHLWTDKAVVLQVEQLGDVLAEHVTKDIERAYPGPVPTSVQVALADHFWCDLLAQLTHVIDSGLKAVDKIPDRVTELILKSRKDALRLPLEELVVKVAVKSVWKFLQSLTIFGWLIQARKTLPAIRILAVLICKAPERHRAVVEYCLDPLKDQLTSETKRRLVKVLREWLPLTVADLERTVTPSPGQPATTTGLGHAAK
jgi:hypothetical protein